jgi:probable rRNA maturation factor
MKNMNVNIINQLNEEIKTDVINQVLSVASHQLNLEESSVNIILVNNELIQDLNQTYRHQSKPTDVLTFPDGTMHNLGDIFISIDKVKEQSKEYGHSFDRELAFLSVHGLLHTLGYDHHTQKEEKKMFTLQENILLKANIIR